MFSTESIDDTLFSWFKRYTFLEREGKRKKGRDREREEEDMREKLSESLSESGSLDEALILFILSS